MTPCCLRREGFAELVAALALAPEKPFMSITVTHPRRFAGFFAKIAMSHSGAREMIQHFFVGLPIMQSAIR